MRDDRRLLSRTVDDAAQSIRIVEIRIGEVRR